MLAPRKLKTFGTLVRRAIAASVALTCLVASSDSITVAIESGTSFPYQAIVLKNDASVRSGPASVHYSTEELPQGATVEVHRHDPGGWCAIHCQSG